MRKFFTDFKRFQLIALVFLILGGISFWYLTRDSEELKIKRIVHALCSLTSKPENESAAMGALKISKSDEVFAPKCRFEFKYEMFSGNYTPREITANLARYWAMFQWSAVTMSDLQILEVNQENASAVFTGFLNGVTAGNKKIEEARDLYCKFIKTDGNWRISELIIREILEK